MVKLLLGHGAHVDKLNSDGRTALHIASRCSHLDVARALIESGSSIDLQDANGSTSLMLASLQGNTAIVELLLNAERLST